MTHNRYPTDPAHTFLTAKEVIARYGWGRTRGYEVLRGPDFPRAIAGRYRLDTLIAWEDAQLAQVLEVAEAITAAAAETNAEVDASTVRVWGTGVMPELLAVVR
jgi:predicted DNA-binding transcriptional regulator AlpA